MTIDRRVWFGGVYGLLWMASSFGCSACYLDRPEPGALGEYPKPRSERAAGSSESAARNDAGPDDASDAEPPRPAAPAPSTRRAPEPEPLSVTIEVSASSVCRGECLTVSGDAIGGKGAIELRWEGDEDWSGPGPHRTCPERDTRYGVNATDTSAPTAMTAFAEVSVQVRSDCEASEPPPEQTAPAPGTPKPVSQWTMMGYDLASTYWNGAERKLTKDSAARLQERFTVELGHEVLGAPLLVDGVLYAGAGDTIVALRVEDGSRLWERTEGAAVHLNSLAFDAGQLYAQLQNSSVLALDASTGDLSWTLEPDRATEFERGYSSPIVVNDLVLVGRSSDAAAFADEAAVSFRGSLLALDKRAGSLVWRTYTVSEDESGAGLWSTPSVDLMSGTVFATTGNNIREPVTNSAGALLAFELETGALRFSHQLQPASPGVPFNSVTMPELGVNPVLYDVQTNGQTRKLVAASSKSGTVSALDRETAELIWEATLGPGTSDRDRGVLSNTAWSGQYLLVATNNGTGGDDAAELCALDGATGKLMWTRALAERVFGKVTVANGVGFVGVGSALEIFDVDTGALIKTLPTGGTTAGGIASIADGLVAFGTGASWLSDQTEAGRIIVLEAKP